MGEHSLATDIPQSCPVFYANISRGVFWCNSIAIIIAVFVFNRDLWPNLHVIQELKQNAVKCGFFSKLRSFANDSTRDWRSNYRIPTVSHVWYSSPKMLKHSASGEICIGNQSRKLFKITFLRSRTCLSFAEPHQPGALFTIIRQTSSLATFHKSHLPQPLHGACV